MESYTILYEYPYEYLDYVLENIYNAAYKIGFAVEFMSESLKRDEKFILAAVIFNPFVLFFGD